MRNRLSVHDVYIADGLKSQQSPGDRTVPTSRTSTHLLR